MRRQADGLQPSHKKVFAAHRLAGWTLKKLAAEERKGSTSKASRVVLPPDSLPGFDKLQGGPLDAELRAFGLATPPHACSLWGGPPRPGSEATAPSALHTALWIFMGAVSAARIASSALMDARWVKPLLDVMETQHRRLASLSKNGGSKSTKRALLELLEFLEKHRQAAQDSLEPGKHKLSEEAAIFLDANLDALYYDLFQFSLRCGGVSPTVPPPHEYFPAMAAAHPGNKLASDKMLMEVVGKKTCRSMAATWGLAEQSGTLVLPAETPAENPLLSVIWSRFQEGCRLLPGLECSLLGQKTREHDSMEAGVGLERKRRRLEDQILLDSSDSDSDGASNSSDGGSLDDDDEENSSEPKAWLGHPALQAFRESGKECHFYAYACPTLDALAALADTAPLIEIGAGLGYWAELLRRRGVEVAAYDSHPPSPSSHAPNEYHGWVPAVFKGGVLAGGPKILGGHSNRSLFLCYPPPGSTMALDCLQRFRGGSVCVVGEWMGDTGAASFTAALLEGFELVQRVPLPNWSDSAHELTVWKRKQTGMSKQRKKGHKGLASHSAAEHTPGLDLASCAVCGSGQGQWAAVTLRRCKWCKDVAYCSQACLLKDEERHSQLHALRWVFHKDQTLELEGKDFETLLF